MFNLSIPELSNEEMVFRYKRIRPVVTKEDGKLYYFREYTFDEISTMSYFSERENVTIEVGKKELKILEGRDFYCINTYSKYDTFYPKISEILAQIDKEIAPFVKAFEVIEYPKNICDLYKDSLTSTVFKCKYHLSRVRLYG